MLGKLVLSVQIKLAQAIGREFAGFFTHSIEERWKIIQTDCNLFGCTLIVFILFFILYLIYITCRFFKTNRFKTSLKNNMYHIYRGTSIYIAFHYHRGLLLDPCVNAIHMLKGFLKGPQDHWKHVTS